MSAAPCVTVGIPFFDEESRLAGAVRSILAQSVTDIEVLLVDDGSTDRSLEIARSITDPRVRVFSDGTRRRLPARLNEIARLARAPLVARMDADDVSHPERLARELALLDDDARYDAVGTWIGLVDEADRPFSVIDCDVSEITPASVLRRGLFPHATMLARRDWLLANPYDEALYRAEDRDLWCRTLKTSRFGVLPAVLYVVRASTRGEFLADYRASQRQNRTLFLRYGPAAMGIRRTAASWLSSQAKSLAMTAAVHAGLAERLVHRRGRPPTREELDAIDAALAAGSQST